MKDKYNSRLAKLVAWLNRWEQAAITLGQTTYYSCPVEQVDVGWRRHEDKHKEQWARDGKLLFAIKYLWWSIRYGYKANPYEVEADDAM